MIGMKPSTGGASGLSSAEMALGVNPAVGEGDEMPEGGPMKMAMHHKRMAEKAQMDGKMHAHHAHMAAHHAMMAAHHAEPDGDEAAPME